MAAGKWRDKKYPRAQPRSDFNMKIIQGSDPFAVSNSESTEFCGSRLIEYKSSRLDLSGEVLAVHVSQQRHFECDPIWPVILTTHSLRHDDPSSTGYQVLGCKTK